MSATYTAIRVTNRQVLATGSGVDVALAIAREPPVRSGDAERPSRFRVYRDDQYVSYAITTPGGIAWSRDDGEWRYAAMAALQLMGTESKKP